MAFRHFLLGLLINTISLIASAVFLASAAHTSLRYFYVAWVTVSAACVWILVSASVVLWHREPEGAMSQEARNQRIGRVIFSAGQSSPHNYHRDRPAKPPTEPILPRYECPTSILPMPPNIHCADSRYAPPKHSASFSIDSGIYMPDPTNSRTALIYPDSHGIYHNPRSSIYPDSQDLHHEAISPLSFPSASSDHRTSAVSASSSLHTESSQAKSEMANAITMGVRSLQATAVDIATPPRSKAHRTLGIAGAHESPKKVAPQPTRRV